ncbi:Fumarate hydratase class I, aerobic [Candidatus Izimaplasma bacterium HR1]|jgi:fumarate hydratase subunit beta|uniref:FumA C-terminus/TtdB family hydratase beta subunit n=1 Tax=Candidatus Izimoplasma sp. HR1 TaxID=1541959 RepID=UPI0004F5D035|nr:Fumarate hydratase class I, aerobic [Candidatus Izimaplasma bacterium HR1]
MIKLNTPITDADIDLLKVGEKVLISGTIFTARDQAHIRLINEDNPKFEINGSVIFYVGPTPARDGVPIGASGPTSSYRMDKLSKPLMEQGLKIMIGKGDRSEEFRSEMIKNHAVYLIATGGAGALLSSCILKSEIIMYEDLGAEAIRKLEVKDFPCFVAYDTYGNDIFKRS